MPFASPSAFVMAQSALPEAHNILLIAQEHHRIVVDAIENREGARAEAIMREHARLAVRNLRLALRNRNHLDLLPALALLTSRRRIEGEAPCVLQNTGWVARSKRSRDAAPGIREITLRPDTPLASYPLGQPYQCQPSDRRSAANAILFAGRRTRNETLRIAVRLAPDSRGGSQSDVGVAVGCTAGNLQPVVAGRHRLEPARPIA
jgi:hypothetical protein